MASLNALSVLVLVLSSSWFSVIDSHGGGVEDATGVAVAVAVAGQREFDYFLLSLQWPGTFCQRTTHCCPQNGCCKSDTTARFTIHGLWPNYNDGTWPACCNGGKFDVKQIKPLLEGIQRYWPTLSCGSTTTCHGSKGLFWAHEWEKHGTCSSPVFKDEYNYFLATLNLYFKYNVTEILRESGYVPSNSEKYPLGGIVSAIQNAVRATPELTCKNGAIKELHLCFYKNFEPRDCDVGGNRLTSSSCPKYVSLPEHVPTNIQGKSIPWSAEAEALAVLGLI